MKLNLSVFFAFLSLSLLFTSGCQSVSGLFESAGNPNPISWVPSMPEETTDAMEGRERPLQTSDPLNIVVVPPNASQTIRVEDIVDGRGSITLPLVGEVLVGRLTTSEAEEVIRKAYVEGEIYRDVNVTVVCPVMRSELERMYYVTGCMRQRGQFPFRDGIRLREAIIAAGDLTDFASGTIVITRNGVSTSYDYNRIKRGKDPDPVLRSRDIIEAKERLF